MIPRSRPLTASRFDPSPAVLDRFGVRPGPEPEPDRRLAALLARRGELKGGSPLESMVSREASFLLNNWAFVVILAIVFIGTLFPVFSELFGERQIVWGPPFYNQVVGPFGIFLLLLTGVGPLIAWRRASPALLKKQFLGPTLFGIAAGVAAWALARQGVREWGLTDVYGVATWGVAAFVPVGGATGPSGRSSGGVPDAHQPFGGDSPRISKRNREGIVSTRLPNFARVAA